MKRKILPAEKHLMLNSPITHNIEYFIQIRIEAVIYQRKTECHLLISPMLSKKGASSYQHYNPGMWSHSSARRCQLSTHSQTTSKSTNLVCCGPIMVWDWTKAIDQWASITYPRYRETPQREGKMIRSIITND